MKEINETHPREGLAAGRAGGQMGPGMDTREHMDIMDKFREDCQRVRRNQEALETMLEDYSMLQHRTYPDVVLEEEFEGIMEFARKVWTVDGVRMFESMKAVLAHIMDQEKGGHYGNR